MPGQSDLPIEEVAASVVGRLRTAPAVDLAGVRPADDDALSYVVRQTADPPPPESDPAAAPGGAAAALELAVAQLSAAATPLELLEAVATYQAAWAGPNAAVLYTAEPDGALRLVATRGLPPDVRSQWTRIPPQVDVPVAVASRRRAPVWLPDPNTILRRFPIFHVLGLTLGAICAVPLLIDNRVTGVIALSWVGPMRFEATQRHHLSVLAFAAARRLSKLDSSSGNESTVDSSGHWLTLALDAVPDAAAVLAPIVEDGEIVDMRIEYENVAAGGDPLFGASGGPGRTLVELMPTLAAQLLVPEYVAVLRTGWPSRLDRVRATVEHGGTLQTVVFTAWGTRVHDRVIVVWRVHGDADLLHEQLVESERVAGVGSFRLHLATGQLTASPYLRRVLGGATVTWRDLLDRVTSADRHAVVRAAMTAVRQGRRITIRARRSGGGPPMELVLTPIAGPDGRVYELRGTCRRLRSPSTMDAA
ncbi:MAG TPA: GAF domain-containing protein [Micromonosporaceae bacterium]|jgi:hypothetical protein|nr:GAF domain-containing protein [Micromonosporaceae bacterium]